MTRPGAAYFDRWYADMASSPARDAVISSALGLPPHLQSTSLLSWQGLDTVVAALGLAPGGRLVDVASGRGGYGIEVAARTGGRLVGVDFSAVALEQAGRSAARLLPPGRAEFRLGTLVATGLPTGSADAALCVDAVQFAEPPLAALAEVRRVLVPGGRLALTTWEAVDPADERVPARVRAVDLARDLPAAGFVDVRVTEQPGWRATERDLWEQALASPPTDAAVRALQDEGRQSLAAWDSLRRVLATAVAP